MIFIPCGTLCGPRRTSGFICCLCPLLALGRVDGVLVAVRGFDGLVAFLHGGLRRRRRTRSLRKKQMILRPSEQNQVFMMNRLAVPAITSI